MCLGHRLSLYSSPLILSLATPDSVRRRVIEFDGLCRIRGLACAISTRRSTRHVYAGQRWRIARFIRVGGLAIHDTAVELLFRHGGCKRKN